MNVHEQVEAKTNEDSAQAELIKLLRRGLLVRRIKFRNTSSNSRIFLDNKGNINYSEYSKRHKLLGCLAPSHKKVNVTELIEVRHGYNTDGLHNAAKSYKFQETAPESSCFSIIYKHPKYVCKSLDFTVKDDSEAAEFTEALKKFITARAKNPLTFDEKMWILENFRAADLNNNGEISMDELWQMLKKLNLQLSEHYVNAIVKEILSTEHTKKSTLNENEFIRLFDILTDLPEYRNAIRLANNEGNEYLTLDETYEFLVKEQGFKDINKKKVQSIISLCETTKNHNGLSVNGFRRLLQSRWGYILKEGHETIFQDMDQPLSHYFINSSHNTYLTGLQVRGNATVEGYISALRKGARLLEYVFDGGNGEPQITHKRTFISSISLRNALKCISNYAFKLNPYPVILTIENHVGLVQQRVMADIFVEILGDMLYIPPDNKLEDQKIPSPNALKNKFLLRGKAKSSPKDEEEISPNRLDEATKAKTIDPEFSRLIALPSAKLSANVYEDIKTHPYNGSPSLSESKVLTYLEAGFPIFPYTAKRIIKSYPKGIRQDSSNMKPMPSWICGIQSVAMNMQTADEEMDIVKGLFNINGNVGYVLKPEVLIKGLDPRIDIENTRIVLSLGVICGQYFPNPEAGDDIVDPLISVEIFGIPSDEVKYRTKAVRNNGFNPVWNETFIFHIYRPELAIMRFSVKDFNSTTTNNFIGEYSVPVNSIRQGYSHIRLNTGFEHSPDDAASILVRIEIESEAQAS